MTLPKHPLPKFPAPKIPVVFSDEEAYWLYFHLLRSFSTWSLTSDDFRIYNQGIQSEVSSTSIQNIQ
jgi:hypothetical protein